MCISHSLFSYLCLDGHLDFLDLVKEFAAPCRLILPLASITFLVWSLWWILLQFWELVSWVSENWKECVHLIVIGNCGYNLLYTLILLWQELRICYAIEFSPTRDRRDYFTVSMALCCDKLACCLVIMNHLVARCVLFPVWVSKLPVLCSFGLFTLSGLSYFFLFLFKNVS